MGSLDRISAHLEPYLDNRPLLARRHYIKEERSGILKSAIRQATELRQTITKPIKTDGAVIIALCDTLFEQDVAKACAQENEAASRPDVLIAISSSLVSLAGELQDARRWKWISENTPELVEDLYAEAEVAREVANSRQILIERLVSVIGIRSGGDGANVTWWRCGQPVQCI